MITFDVVTEKSAIETLKFNQVQFCFNQIVLEHNLLKIFFFLILVLRTSIMYISTIHTKIMAFESVLLTFLDMDSMMMMMMMTLLLNMKF